MTVKQMDPAIIWLPCARHTKGNKSFERYRIRIPSPLSHGIGNETTSPGFKSKFKLPSILEGLRAQVLIQAHLWLELALTHELKGQQSLFMNLSNSLWTTSTYRHWDQRAGLKTLRSPSNPCRQHEAQVEVRLARKRDLSAQQDLNPASACKVNSKVPPLMR